MAPEACNGTFKHLVLGPILDGAAFSAIFHIETTGALHVETDHMIVGMAAHGAREFYARSDSSIVTATHLIERINLGHDMDAARRMGDFQKSEAVMPSVTVHEPQSLYGLIGIG